MSGNAQLDNSIQVDAAALLSDGRVRLVIGYRRQGEQFAALVTDARKVECLTYDPACRQNLAAYLKKPEVKALLPAAVVASPPVVRSLLVLAAEAQLAEDAVLALAVDAERYYGAMDLQAAAQFLTEKHPALAPEADLLRKVGELALMSARDRAAFWREQLARCTRCYACRAACPGCYCQRCIVEKNTPQWVSTAAAQHGNYGWHVIRAFHQVGRCTSCGACEAACPQGIPLGLLNAHLASEIEKEFGCRPGYSPTAEPFIGSWKPEDNEEFIR